MRWNLGQATDGRRRRLDPKAERDAPIGLSPEERRNVRERWVWHLPLATIQPSALSIREDAPGYFDMLAHPSYDAFWERFDISRRHDRFEVPALHLTGWYDSLLVGTLRNFEGIEHTLIDESEPADERWYRHVIYGWDIYALYSGQPFPGLARAIERGTESDVTREASRIERAPGRMSSGLDALLASF